MKVKLLQQVNLQAGSDFRNIKTYAGEAGKILDVPKDVGKLLITQGYAAEHGKESTKEATPAPPAEPPKAPSRHK